MNDTGFPQLGLYSSRCFTTETTGSSHGVDNMRLLKRMSLERTIVAATSLLREIYVMFENSDTLHVYFCHTPYHLKTYVSIAEMNPVDIATSYVDVCVYALDSINACIWRIHRNMKSTKYPLDVNQSEGLKSMSITKKGLIIVVQNGNKILMYNPVKGETKYVLVEGVEDGQFIEHAVEVDDKCLLACHNTQTFLYDLDRREVRSSVDVGGNHITVNNNKCAVIVDKARHQVCQLDVEKIQTKETSKERPANASYMMRLLKRNWVENPRHVHYGMENGLLLVAWLSYLDILSFETFDAIDTECQLSGTKNERHHEPEAEWLHTGAHQNENYKGLPDCVGETTDFPASANKWSETDSDAPQNKAGGNEDEMRKLLHELSSKFEGQFFYDTEDDKVHIAVSEGSGEIVKKELEGRWSFKYQMEKPVESRFQRGCNTTLQTGASQLVSVRGEGFMFSGTVLDEKTGITVAHAVQPDEDVMTFKLLNGQKVRQIVGKCLQTFRDVQVQRERCEYSLTADMAVLNLLPDFYLRKNLIHWAGREFRVKIYKERRVPANTEVMVLDKEGIFRSGIIRREPFTDTSLERRQMDNLYNVLGIGTGVAGRESAITQHGDSGALVLSVPSERSGDSEDDVLYVYGIVIALYSWSESESSHENSLTIANSLGEVIEQVFISENVVNRVKNIPVDNIDFTEKDYDPNAQ